MMDTVLRAFRSITRAAIGVVLLLVVLPAVSRAMDEARKCTEYSWSASRAWISCAETARAEGVWLAAKSGDLLIPAADVSLADDIGHNLLCEAVGITVHRPVVASDIAQINVALCAAGVMAMICLLLAAQFDVAALIIAWAAPQIIQAASTAGTSPHSAHPGLVLLALLLPIVAGALAQADKPASLCGMMATEHSALRERRWLLLSFFAMICAILVRGAYLALAASALAGCVLTGLWLRNRSWRMGVRPSRQVLLTSMVLLAIAMCTPTIILRTRDAIWPVAAAKHIESHGISHNLFIGLGAVDNSLGVKWDDGNAYEFAKKLDPSVEYVTARYYSLLWQQYFAFWREQPREMIAVYGQKCKALLSERAWGRLPLWSVGLLSLAMAVASCTRLGKRPAGPISHALVLVGACIMVLLLLLQGVATHFVRQYWAPIEILFALEIAVFADFTLRLIETAIRSRCQATLEPRDRPGQWLLTSVAIAATIGPVVFLWGPASA